VFSEQQTEAEKPQQVRHSRTHAKYLTIVFKGFYLILA